MQKVQNTKAATGKSSNSNFTLIVFLAAIAVSILTFMFVLGSGKNFVGGDNHNVPIPNAEDGFRNILGTIYKGGFVVPIIITCLLLVIIFTIERMITISKATGNGKVDTFLVKVKTMVDAKDFDGALAECNRQKGSVANVLQSGILKYKEVVADPTMDKEEKKSAIEKDLEETTSLELPMLEKNLVIIATIASIATLLGLFGTVLGMIRAFSAMATSGAPDAVALSTGISEALINTAFGIGTSALAIIFYNFFTTKIDVLTYRIDEAGFSLAQSFASNYHENK